MDTLPTLERKLSISAGAKNKSLIDVFTAVKTAVKVISVETVKTPLYNTKAVIIVKTDELLASGEPKEKKRSVLYNRIDIATILPEKIKASLSDIKAVIEELNSQHRLDITEDDIEIVGGVIKAKPTSLGYYNTAQVEVAGVPANEVSFGIRDLDTGEGYQWFGYLYHQLIVVIDGVAYSQDPIQYTPDGYSENDDRQIRFADDLTALITESKPELEVTHYARDFYVGSNRDEGSLDSVVMKLTNTSDVDIEVAAYLLTLDRDGVYLPDHACIFLPVTLLKAKGSTTPKLPSFSVLSTEEFESGFDRKFSDDPDGGFEDWDSYGRHIRYNNATGTNNVQHEHMVDGDLGMDIERGWSGVQNSVLTYVRMRDEGFDGGYVDQDLGAMFFNVMETPLTINYAGASKPVELGPVQTETPLDRVMFNLSGKLSSELNNSTDKVVLVINDFEYPIVSEDAPDEHPFYAYQHAFPLFKIKYPEVASKINLGVFNMVGGAYSVFYMENLTDEKLTIGLKGVTLDGSVDELTPTVVLEPKGTNGSGYNVSDQITTTVDTPELTELFNDEKLQTLTWRGVTHDISELNDEFYPDETWYEVALGRIFDIKGHRTMKHLAVPWCPFKETFIFNQGLSDEVEVSIHPRQIVTAVAQPE